MWITNKRTRDKIRAVETEHLRKVYEVTRLDKIRKKEVKMRMEIHQREKIDMILSSKESKCW